MTKPVSVIVSSGVAVSADPWRPCCSLQSGSRRGNEQRQPKRGIGQHRVQPRARCPVTKSAMARLRSRTSIFTEDRIARAKRSCTSHLTVVRGSV